jgi:metal-responsive CopG/Arc/MetJ family transcriptional regulator
MPVKVTILIDEKLLSEIDRRVANGELPNRSRAVQDAIRALQ